MEFLPALIFASVAAMGFLAAKHPELFARYFLSESQRERLVGRMDSLSWTGWVIFGCGLFAVAFAIVGAASHR